MTITIPALRRLAGLAVGLALLIPSFASAERASRQGSDRAAGTITQVCTDNDVLVITQNGVETVVLLDDSTRFFSRPNTPGDAADLLTGLNVTVRGALDCNGSVLQASDVVIRPRAVSGGSRVQIDGTIVSIDLANGTITVEEADGTEIEVAIAGARIFEAPGDPGDTSDLEVGQTVRIRGTEIEDGDGDVRASDVVIRP